MTTSTTATDTRSNLATLWALRAAAVISVLSILYQGFSASGVIVAGDPALGPHETGAIVAHVVTGLMAAAAAVHWRATRGPVWPTLLAVIVFGVTFLEASLGHKGSLWVHVPLALLIILATGAVLFWSFWRPRSSPR